MPLDLKKIITQIQNLESLDSRKENHNRLESTYKLFEIANENHSKLFSRLIETRDSKGANFYFATPELAGGESLDTLHYMEKDFKSPHITIATDGSQINPSAHEFTGASLINIGLVGIPYFKSSIPVTLSSEPTVYSNLDKINHSTTQDTMYEEDLISYERTLKEVEELVNLAIKYSENNIPIVALLDGTLIHWHIERFSETYIQKFIERFSGAILKLKSMGIPVASFLSNSRSNELINMLRIFKCPFEEVNCKKHCSNTESKNLPCNPTMEYKPVLDRKLIEKLFEIKKAEFGTRTVLFKSNSKILNYYPEDLKIYFFYINTGSEVARVEFPAYVMNNTKLLTLLHHAIAIQCKAGFGYPVTLSEAHLLAVVNKADRDIFYNLLKEQTLKTKDTKIRLSNKELKKRISFV